MKYSGLEILARILFSPQRADVVNGLENIPDKPFIMAINHRSVYDPIIIVLSILKKIDKKIIFLADEKLLCYIPESFNKLIGVVPSSLDGLRKAKMYLIEGFPVGVFMVPRVPDKKNRIGASWLATKTGYPIVPAAISGRVIHGNAFTFATHLFAGYFERKRIIYGEPLWISRDDHSDLFSISNRVVTKIKNLENQLSSAILSESELHLT